MAASGKRNFNDCFPALDLNSELTCHDPKRPKRFPESGLSAKPRFCEQECSEAAFGDLTHPATSCQSSDCPDSGRWIAAQLLEHNANWMHTCSLVSFFVSELANKMRGNPSDPFAFLRFFGDVDSLLKASLRSNLPHAQQSILIHLGIIMAYRNGNYAAFYVAEPFNASALGAHATKDFHYYNMLRAWKGKEASFPFNDSHDKTYNVRDNSDWETTLKPRLRERLRNSKNIVLFLSSNTKNSRAIKEEIDYGINNQGLPVIVVYPEYDSKESLLANGTMKQSVKNIWNNLPIFRDSMSKVPTLHIPIKKDIIEMALTNKDFMLATKTTPDYYWYTP